MKLPPLKPDSVFANLARNDIENALKFADAEDFGETHGVSEAGLARLVKLGFVRKDDTNHGLYWQTPRLEELVLDVAAANDSSNAGDVARGGGQHSTQPKT